MTSVVPKSVRGNTSLLALAGAEPQAQRQSTACLLHRLNLRLVVERLLLNGPLLAARLPGKLALHVRIKALQDGEAVLVVVIKPAGEVEPVPIMAGMHRAELHVKVADDVGVALTRHEGFSGFHSLADGIDHAMTQISALVENDDLGVLVVVEEPRGIGPRVTFISLKRNNAHHMPAELVNVLEKVLVNRLEAVTLFRIERHTRRMIAERRRGCSFYFARVPGPGGPSFALLVFAKDGIRETKPRAASR